ncbi:myosin light chain 6B-like [Clytia hemisphaerica]|uniref:EF-hand domain-containing protein n=1 Tax=Clytia hemisphaerica TaxID=252671 RepID=A0A7M5X792_9CNID
MAKISEDELDDIKERYELFDKKGDGKIDAAQIIDVLRACGQNPLKPDVDKIIKESELDGKRVELEVFCGIYEQISKAPGQACFEDMVEAFKTYDKESNGSISSAQIRQLLINLGDTLTEQEADIILAPHEDDQSNISYQQLIKSLVGEKK